MTDVPMAMLQRPLLSALAGDEEIERLLSDEAQLGAILAFEAALAQAEADADVISSAAAAAIVQLTGRFEPDWRDLASGMARDGVVIPSLVRQLRLALGEPHAAAIHHGATSQDAIDTALVLQLAKIIPIFSDRIGSLISSFSELGNRWGATALMAHTRMQSALEFTVADKLKTWSEPLERENGALSAMRSELLVVQLGGPIGNRSNFPEGEKVARALAKRLDLGIASPWHSTRDPIIALGSLLSLITGSLGKFGMDVALMAQTEVRAIKLAGGGTSSAMPHKSNPVAAEVLVALARYNAGLAGALHQAMVHENERSGAAWTLEWLTLTPMLITTGASLRLANLLVREISF